MPGRDQTGPEGKGPLTGRQLGNCRETNANNEMPFNRGIKGLGLGLGRGIRQGNGPGQGRRFRGGRKQNW